MNRAVSGGIFSGLQLFIRMSLYTDQACVLRDATAICVWILIYEILGSPIIGFTGSAVWLGHAAGTCWRQDLSGQ